MKHATRGRFIYIPTYLRSESQPFYRQVQEAGYDPLLVVDHRDPQDYSPYTHVRIKVKGIAAKRAWIAEQAIGVHVVADDDLILLRVTEDGRTLKASAGEVGACMRMIDVLGGHYAHGGVHRRAFVNSAAHLNYKTNTGGYGSLLFYNTYLWHKPPRFSIPKTPKILTDLCSQLDLFKQRLPFAVITAFATKELHALEHFQTGCWAPALGLKKPEVIAEAEASLMRYFQPRMKQGRRREIIDWRATREAWQVPEHLCGEPRLPKIRVSK